MIANIGIASAYLGMGFFCLSVFFLIVGCILVIKRFALKRQTKPSTAFLFALGFFISAIIFILIGSLTGVIVS